MGVLREHRDIRGIRTPDIERKYVPVGCGTPLSNEHILVVAGRTCLIDIISNDIVNKNVIRSGCPIKRIAPHQSYRGVRGSRRPQSGIQFIHGVPGEIELTHVVGKRGHGGIDSATINPNVIGNIGEH
jgi:hypothetical protein